jgi:hypothetical protein
MGSLHLGSVHEEDPKEAKIERKELSIRLRVLKLNHAKFRSQEPPSRLFLYSFVPCLM